MPSLRSMNFHPASMRLLLRLGAMLVLGGVLLSASIIFADAPNATPNASPKKQYEDLLTPQERRAQPRKAIVQAMLAPQPNRPKPLGGFKEKARDDAEIHRAFTGAPRVSPPRRTSHPAERVCSWAWFSRAPPFST
jgi:hypothetical protein